MTTRPQTAEAPAAAAMSETPPRDEIGRKDRLALAVSVASFVVSGTTLALNRLDAHESASSTEAKASYSAFQLGKRYATAFIIYTQVRNGDPEKIEGAKREALSFVRQAQSYAEALDIRMQLPELLTSYRYADKIIPEDPFSAIETRLNGNYGPKVTGKYLLASWLTWLHVNGQVTLEKHPEFAPEFRKGYPSVANIINVQLKDFGLNERVSAQMPDAPTLKAETLKALEAAERKLQLGGG